MSYSAPEQALEESSIRGRHAAAARAASGVPAAPPRPAAGKPQTYVKDKEDPYANVGRNDPCPCGSGKKFKKCHGQNLSTHTQLWSSEAGCRVPLTKRVPQMVSKAVSEGEQ